MCNSQYVMRPVHHDGGVQLDRRYEVGHDASATKVHSFYDSYFLNF